MYELIAGRQLSIKMLMVDGIIDDADKVAIGATTKPNLIYGLVFPLNGKDWM